MGTVETPFHTRKMKAAKKEMVGGKWTGSMQATDVACKDCGAELVAGQDSPYHLICSRIFFHLNGVPRPKPEENTVIECNNYVLPEQNG